MKTIFTSFILIMSCIILNAQQDLNQILNKLESQTSFYGNIAHTIWNYAEMGYMEEKSTALLQKTLKPLRSKLLLKRCLSKMQLKTVDLIVLFTCGSSSFSFPA